MMQERTRCSEGPPQAFVSRLAASVFHFNRRPSEFKDLGNNLLPMGQYDRTFSLLVRGQPAALFGTALDAGPPQQQLRRSASGVDLPGVAMAAIATGAVLAVRLCRATRIRRTAGSLAFTLAAAGMVVNVFDTWENNRARFRLEPSIVLSVWH